MTKEGEARLRAALDAVVDMVNSGEAPDDAIVKVASEQAIQPGHVGLMVHAYNTGRTTRHRESHSSLLDKAADFPIADAPAILERLYPSRVKSAAAIERESGVHIDYTMSPAWYTRASHATGMEKAAEAVDWKMSDRQVTAYPTVRDLEAGDRIKVARQKAARAEEEDRLQASRIQNDIMAGFAKLAEYFAGYTNLTLHDVRDNVETLYGNEGMAVLRQLDRTRPNLVKRASTGRFHSAAAEPYQTIGHLVKLAGQLRQMIACNEKRAAERAAALEELERPFVPAPRQSLLDPLSLPMTKRAIGEGLLGGINDIVGSEFIQPTIEQLRPTDKDKLVQKKLEQIATPQHEQQLRDIRTRAMLEDMLSNDPVIQGHDRDDVLSAFNEVSQLAPRASQQPLLMNAMLRTRLQQGSLDPFQTGELVKTEQGLKNIGSVPAPPGAKSGPPSASVLA
jgi:hypothetical protein